MDMFEIFPDKGLLTSMKTSDDQQKYSTAKLVYLLSLYGNKVVKNV